MNADDAQDSDWTVGVHGVRALLTTAPERIRRLLVAEGRRSREVEALARMARDAGVRVDRVPRRALDRQVRRPGQGRDEGPGNHQGIAAERHAFVPATERELEARWASFEEPLIVVLDGIEDPRNLGACLRTAEAAGASAVLVPRRRSAPLSAIAAKTASGAVERLFIVEVANLARRLAWLKEQGVWLTGGIGEHIGSRHTEIDYRGAAAIIVGSEGKGLGRLIREHCDHLVHIPMAGEVRSLNVSVALGILLFEVRRQRALESGGKDDG